MITKAFEEEYKKLNKAQKEAVDAIEGPVMVIAGPGTGKTTILTLRIANILRLTDTPPSGILALTFTDAGVKAMRKKLREIIGERALEVPIHTFHGFAASVLSEFGDHLPHLARSKQITEVEAESIVREIIKDSKYKKLRPLGDPDYYIQKIIGGVSDCKQEAWTPEMAREHAKAEIERIKNDPESISSRGATKGRLKAEAERKIEKCERTVIFADVYAEYEMRKKEQRRIDFDDLIFELLLALKEDELLKKSLQEKYLYILVDEHQDTNDSQNMIIKILADFFETPNLFVVGDEKQAIYRFQGASVENFLSFQKTWKDIKTISLGENYRSHQKILDASFAMIEKNYSTDELSRLRVRLAAGSNVPETPLEVISAPNMETEELNLVDRVREIIGKDLGNIAIIVRKNSEVSKIFRLLEAEGVPASAERGTNIFGHPLGILAFSLFSFLNDPSESESLALTLAGNLWNLDFKTSAKLIKSVRSGNLAEIEKTLPVIKELRSEIKDSGVVEFLIMAGEESGLLELASKDPLSMEVWRGIIGLAEEIAGAKDIEDPGVLITELMSYKKSAERRSIKIKTGQVGSKVAVMTAHSSKGLEFDYVFLPYATEESWIRRSRGSAFVLPKDKEEGDDTKDERRLFYVSLTRAKRHVVISFHREDGSGSLMTPLRFIDELDRKFIARTEIEGKEKKNSKTNLERKKKKQNKELVEYSKRILEENGLSVTALNHFANCPSEFFYKSILKIPEAPSPSSEKGNAMHQALSDIWKYLKRERVKDYNEKKAAGIIEETVKNYLKNSFLPKNEKEAVLLELLENAPGVAKSLREHFSQKGNVTTEGWFEGIFEHKINAKNVELKLHGKLDALLEQDNRVLIYDYKTREAMSERAIKGETRNEDGNYFRQLVFYKILLRNNSRFADKEINPALVFVKPNSRVDCPTVFLPITKSDMEKTGSEIKALIESVWSGTLLSATCTDPACKYCALKKLGGRDL